MTRRILAGFLGVLLVVLVAVVVPLGFAVTARERTDFLVATRASADALAAVAEESDDHAVPAALRAATLRVARQDNGVLVLDRAGQTVARAGPAIPAAVVTSARAGHPLPHIAGRVVVRAPVQDSGAEFGAVIVVRDAAPLRARERSLWLALAAAGTAALCLGAVVAWGLARWISRPIRGLVATTSLLGTGNTEVRADVRTGPQPLRALAATFNDMADRVNGLLAVQRNMTADVAHQLRTPLAALRLRLELLADELSGARAEEIESIVGETTRLARLVDGLLAVARAETSSSAPEPVDVVAIAESRRSIWEPLAAEREIELVVEGRAARADVTPGHLEQVLDNLLDNALEAVHQRGRIAIILGAEDSCVSVAVADDGPGMSPERRARALDRFETDRSGNGGTGLGLAVVDRLVRADRGRVELRQRAGGGLTVVVLLPSSRPPTGALG